MMAAEPIEPPTGRKSTKAQTVSIQSAQVFEYQADEIGLVLRTLARQARMNVIIRPEVQGTVTLRIEDKTPREVFHIIVEGKGYKT